jgi:hypothetical protein
VGPRLVGLIGNCRKSRPQERSRPSAPTHGSPGRGSPDQVAHYAVADANRQAPEPHSGPRAVCLDALGRRRCCPKSKPQQRTQRTPPPRRSIPYFDGSRPSLPTALIRIGIEDDLRLAEEPVAEPLSLIAQSGSVRRRSAGFKERAKDGRQSFGSVSLTRRDW